MYGMAGRCHPATLLPGAAVIPVDSSDGGGFGDAGAPESPSRAGEDAQVDELDRDGDADAFALGDRTVTIGLAVVVAVLGIVWLAVVGSILLNGRNPSTAGSVAPTTLPTESSAASTEVIESTMPATTTSGSFVARRSWCQPLKRRHQSRPAIRPSRCHWLACPPSCSSIPRRKPPWPAPSMTTRVATTSERAVTSTMEPPTTDTAQPETTEVTTTEPSTTEAATTEPATTEPPTTGTAQRKRQR